MKVKSKFTYFISSSLIIILLSLVLLETALRIFAQLIPEPVRYMVSLPSAWHPVLGVVQMPNIHSDLSTSEFVFHVDTHDLGLGGLGFRETPPDRTNPVVVLGDSFTWGVGVNKADIWTELVELKSGVDFCNLAYGGYGTTQERLTFELWGVKLKPRGIILQICVNNDFLDNLEWEENFKVNKNSLTPLLMSLRSWLHHNVRSYELFKYYILGGLLKKGSYADFFSKKPQGEKILNVKVGGTEVKILKDYSFLSMSPRTEEGWRVMQSEIMKINKLCKQNNAWFCVVIFPAKEQVYAQYYNPPVNFDIDLLNKLIAKFCKNQDIFVLDLTLEFRNNMRSAIFWEINGHLTPLGHKIVSDCIYSELRKEKLL